MDDAPAAEISAGRDGSVGGKNNGPTITSPIAKHVRLRHEAGGVKCARNDAHGLLRVVAAVTQTVSGSREKLQLTKPFIDSLGRLRFWKIQCAATMNSNPRNIPMTGATTMKMRVLYQPSGMMTENMVAVPV